MQLLYGKYYPTLDDITKDIKLPFELMPKQRWAFEQVTRFHRGAYFNEVGTGKTVLATLTALHWQARKVVVTMPPILLDQWEAWLRSVNQTSVSIYRGPRRTEDLLEAKWVLMSHNIFRDSFEAVKRHYSSLHDVFIGDEFHAAKNPASILFKRTKELIANDGKILMLTGTPTNKPDDSYAYIKLKSPTIYRNKGHFDNCHVAERDIFNNVTKWQDLEGMAEALALQTVKLTYEETFGEKLEAIYDPMLYSLDTQHMKLYKQLLDEQLLLLPDNGKIDATTSQKLQHAMQQIIVNWSHFAGEPKRAAAYDVLDEVIEQTQCMDESKSKLCVWMNYQMSNKSVIAYLRKKYGDRAIAAAYGGVDSAKGVDAAKNDPKSRILVAHYQSAGVGMDKYQLVCSEMLMLEAPKTSLEMRQTIGRIVRSGQTRKPHVRFAIAKGTVQTRLFNQLLKKDDLVSTVERTKESLREMLLGKD
jgi:SNF2 family DNA or RNA helicase